MSDHKASSRIRKELVWVLIVTAALTVILLIVVRIRNRQSSPFVPDYWPTNGWQSSTPEEQGLDSVKLAEGLKTIQQNNIPIHSLMIIRNGWEVLDATFYPYDGQTPHNLGSVTKSLMTTLIGIAADQGKLSLDQPVVSFFPDRIIANLDARKNRITVRHLASLTSGLDCVGLEGGEATMREMESSQDWVQFALDRKAVTEAGTHFVYCGVDMHLLSAILQHATGMTALEFARQNLFAPLGIQMAEWTADPQGYNQASGGLSLTPRDMAKIGFLWLNHGVWDGKQVVSSKWVEDSITVQTKTGLSDDYGFGWWVNTGDLGLEYNAYGDGGQKIHVIPGLNLILVTTGSGFNADDVVSLLAPALVDLEIPLPANPGGISIMTSVLTSLQQAPTPQTITLLPKLARTISGKTFTFESNLLELSSMQIDFNNSAKASIQFAFADGTQSPSAQIGLDGIYRMTSDVGLDRAFRTSLEINHPVGLRGNWINAQTFVLEYETVTNRYAYRIEMTFADKQVSVKIMERIYQSSMTLEGQRQSP